MDAELIADDAYPLGAAIAYVIWKLPRKLPGSDHPYKYRLALVARGTNVQRYDNEAGKGDHRHLGGREFVYDFVDIPQLQVDFWKDVEEWQNAKKGS